MKISRTYKLRLKPSTEQEATLRAICAGVRQVYNAANEQRIMYGRAQGTDPHGRNSFFNSNRQVKEVGFRASKVLRGDQLVNELGLQNDPELSWIAEDVPADSLRFALTDLDQAWDKFFKNVKNKEAKNLPGFRTTRDDSSFRLSVWSRNAKGSSPVCLFGRHHVRLPKIGYIPYVKHCKLRGTLKQATVKLEGARWYICVVSELVISDPIEYEANCVGVDLGTVNPVVLSDGTTPDGVYALKSDPRITKRKKRLQREIARAKKGSKRRRRVIDELARVSLKESAHKRAGLHRITTALVKEFTHIAIEDLKVKKMVESGRTRRKKGKSTHSNKVQAAFNRAFLDVPKYAFRAQLEYKAKAAGVHVLAVDPSFTSQTCPSCGTVSKHSRVRQDTFCCTACGHTEHADLVGSINILNRAFPNHRLMMTGTVSGPRKTPLRSAKNNGNSEQRKSGTLSLQMSAASNPMANRNPATDDGRGGSRFRSSNDEVANDDGGLQKIGTG